MIHKNLKTNRLSVPSGNNSPTTSNSTRWARTIREQTGQADTADKKWLQALRALAAGTLQFCHREHLIHFPDDVTPENVIRTVQHGLVRDTGLNQRIWSHGNKIISDALLNNEITIDAVAEALSLDYPTAVFRLAHSLPRPS